MPVEMLIGKGKRALSLIRARKELQGEDELSDNEQVKESADVQVLAEGAIGVGLPASCDAPSPATWFRPPLDVAGKVPMVLVTVGW